MNKNVKAILISILALLIVSFMYIGGLISDAKRDAANEKKEQIKTPSEEKTENSSNTNILSNETKSELSKKVSSSQSHSSSNINVK